MASNKPSNAYQRISCQLIIPGSGAPIKNGIVILKNNMIDYVGKLEEAPFYETYDVDIKVPIIMPGLWDAHVHFLGITKIAQAQNKGNLNFVATTPSAIAVGRCIKQLSTAIKYGITSVREVGGFGLYLKKLVNEGSIIGPNIYSAGKMLSITSGHGDFHEFPLEFVCMLSNGDHVTSLVDGNDECLKAVRKNVRNGCDLIKLHATGGVLSVNDSLEARQFSDNEIKTIVEESRRSGLIVAGHAHGKEGIEACIDNGVYTIEHASFLDDRLAKKLKDNNCILVPTRFIGEFASMQMQQNKNISPKSMEVVKNVIECGRNALKIALKHDIKIACGTDMLYDLWGKNMQELQYYVEGGMSELQAIETATYNGPATLGPYKNIKSGLIKKGYDADIIALSKNPLDDIKVLQDEKNIVMVWKHGEILKNIYNNTAKSKL